MSWREKGGGELAWAADFVQAERPMSSSLACCCSLSWSASSTRAFRGRRRRGAASAGGRRPFRIRGGREGARTASAVVGIDARMSVARRRLRATLSSRRRAPRPRRRHARRLRRGHHHRRLHALVRSVRWRWPSCSGPCRRLPGTCARRWSSARWCSRIGCSTWSFTAAICAPSRQCRPAAATSVSGCGECHGRPPASSRAGRRRLAALLARRADDGAGAAEDRRRRTSPARSPGVGARHADA